MGNNDISQKNKNKFNPKKHRDINRKKHTKYNANHTRNHNNNQKANKLDIKQENQQSVEDIQITKEFNDQNSDILNDFTIQIKKIDLEELPTGENYLTSSNEENLPEPIETIEETIEEVETNEQPNIEVVQEQPTIIEEPQPVEQPLIVEEQPKKAPKQPFYIGYSTRIVFHLLTSIILIVFANFIIGNNIQFTNEKSINYREQSNLDYKVYLKPNTFYDKEYLDKGMSYIAGLINKINIDFVYSFASDSNLSVDFDYDVVGLLEIKDESGNNTYFTKEYIIVNSKNYQLIEGQTYGLQETVSIDYDYYNNLANSFKSAYGINTQSNLRVFLRLNKRTADQNLSMQNTGNMYVTIPLSQKSINIGLDYKDINESHNVIDKSKLKINNYLQIFLSITLYVLALLSLIKFIKLISALRGKTSKYDKYVNKILFQYDRLIIESNEELDLKEYNVIPIKQFKELLDARDNLKAPIMYKPLIKHQKCYFYIKKREDLYLLIVKEVDIEDGTLK